MKAQKNLPLNQHPMFLLIPIKLAYILLKVQKNRKCNSVLRLTLNFELTKLLSSISQLPRTHTPTPTPAISLTHSWYPTFLSPTPGLAIQTQWQDPPNISILEI
jgi:hypothetical protein